MKSYNNEKDNELKLRINAGDSFSYDELIQFEKDGLLEDFDSFDVNSQYYKEGLCVYYCKGKYYLITRSRNIRPIDSTLLHNRQMTVVSRSITNNIQHYVQIHGKDALEKLSKDEIIDLITGSEYRPSEQITLEDLAQELDER